MDDALDHGHHEFEWAAYCDEYDDIGVTTDVLWAQRKYSVFLIFPCISSVPLHFLSEGQQPTAVRSSNGHCFIGSIVIRGTELG